MSLGSDLNDSTLNLFRDLSKKHGFKLAELRQFGKSIDPHKWEQWIYAKNNKVSTYVADGLCAVPRPAI